ncbi:MAG: hypothetical protein JWR26_1411 [Pedosphaera sp.]|nr:hypothetical protein [Pedosphaera sp.]
MPLWNRLGPAMCILLLTLLFCAGRNEVTKNLGAEGHSNALASLFLSSHNSVASYTGIVERSEGGTPGVTFDWTKGGSSLSTTGSFLFGRTNM